MKLQVKVRLSTKRRNAARRTKTPKIWTKIEKLYRVARESENANLERRFLSAV